jgi:opacity protein-like surface antigen
MNTHCIPRIVLVATFALLGTLTSARAQGYISPLMGFDFGGDSGCQQVANCEDKRLNVGIAFGALGPILGFEEEISDARNFFGSVPSQSSSVVTVMSNVMLVPAFGPVHPYVTGGIGLIKTHVEFTTSSLLSTTNNSLGWDTGGGVMVFFSRHVGIRGDIRHFHTFQRITVPLIGTTFGDERLTFGRVSGALVLGF